MKPDRKFVCLLEDSKRSFQVLHVADDDGAVLTRSMLTKQIEIHLQHVQHLKWTRRTI